MVRTLPILLLAAGALGAGVALPARAGTVYRCDGADGSRSYASSPVKGAKCKAVGGYSDAPSRPAPAAQASPATTEPAAMQAAAAAPAPAKRAGTPRVVQGQVYSYIKDGVRHYTSKRPSGGASSVRTISYSFIEDCFACSASPSVDFGNVRLNTSAYQAEVAAAAKEYGVDEAVVRAVIHAESAFDPKARSHVGAQGLMQLMPATAERFGVRNAFDASQNIRGGVKYLSWLLERFDGNLTLAAAGYNAGEGAVDKYDGVPPYKETQRYVQRVGILADRYRQALAAR